MATIQKYCHSGIIRAEIKGTNYNIDESQVEEWKARFESKLNRTAHNAVYSKRGVKNVKPTPHQNKNLLAASMHKLVLYNKEHGTSYSYGEAVARGII